MAQRQKLSARTRTQPSSLLLRHLPSVQEQFPQSQAKEDAWFVPKSVGLHNHVQLHADAVQNGLLVIKFAQHRQSVIREIRKPAIRNPREDCGLTILDWNKPTKFAPSLPRSGSGTSFLPPILRIGRAAAPKCHVCVCVCVCVCHPLYQRVLTSPDYCWHHGPYKILINCSNIAEKDCRGTGHS